MKEWVKATITEKQLLLYVVIITIIFVMQLLFNTDTEIDS